MSVYDGGPGVGGFFDGQYHYETKETPMATNDDLIQVPEAEYREAVKALGKVEVLEAANAALADSNTNLSSENVRLWAANTLLRSAATRACGKMRVYSETEDIVVSDTACNDVVADIEAADGRLGEIVDLYPVAE